MREYQVRICERLGVKFPGPTRQSRYFGCETVTSGLHPIPDNVAAPQYLTLCGCRRFDPVTAYYRQASPCERIKQMFTCRVQRFMHLLSFVPAPGLAHLPTQFEN
jgi:hypothetical protein